MFVTTRRSRACEPSWLVVLLEEHDFVAQGHQVVGYRQGSRTGPDQSHPLSVLLGRSFGQEMADLAFEIGGHSLEPANGHGLVTLQPTAPAGGFARAIAGASQDPREDVGLPIHHVGVGVAPLGNQADIFRHVGVRRTGPLAINDLMVVIGILSICWFHLVMIMKE